MAKHNSKTFGVGVVLAISFFAVLALIFSPVFGGRAVNGLTYADDLFNKLSKGSSYFIPKLQKSVQGFAGRPFEAAGEARQARDGGAGRDALHGRRGHRAADGGKLTVSGDLGAVLAAVLRDSDEMYQQRRQGGRGALRRQGEGRAAGLVDVVLRGRQVPEEERQDRGGQDRSPTS